MMEEIKNGILAVQLYWGMQYFIVGLLVRLPNGGFGSDSAWLIRHMRIEK